MSRFFAFGCSYTDYGWATWADLLCHHYHSEGYEVHNYGSAGMGNQHILDALVQADLKHNIVDSDVVCVLWSSWVREDRLWPLPEGDVAFGKMGSLLNADNDAFVAGYLNFRDQYFNLENYVMKTVTAIVAANRAFNINYQAHITPNEEYDHSDMSKGDELLKQFCLFSPDNKFYNTSNIEYLQERIFYANQVPTLNEQDGHPAPGVHMAFVKHQVAPALGITLRGESLKWMKNQHKQTMIIDKQFDSETYRHTLEVQKRKTLPFMKDWRDLWDSRQEDDNDLQWGPVNKGVLNGLTRAIKQHKLH